MEVSGLRGLKQLGGKDAGGAGTPRDRRRQLPGVGRCRWARSGGSRWSREPPPPPWAGGAFISAGLVAVTQRRESCWGLSPPQGLPGPGPCHTPPPRWLVPRAWLARRAAGSSVSPRSPWSSMLLSPLVADAPVPCIPLVTESSVPAVPFYPSGHLTKAPVTSVSLVTDAPVLSYPRCHCPLRLYGFVLRGSAGCKGTRVAVGTCHQHP